MAPRAGCPRPRFPSGVSRQAVLCEPIGYAGGHVPDRPSASIVSVMADRLASVGCRRGKRSSVRLARNRVPNLSNQCNRLLAQHLRHDVWDGAGHLIRRSGRGQVALVLSTVPLLIFLILPVVAILLQLAPTQFRSTLASTQVVQAISLS